MSKPVVCLLCGGQSPEHEVSLLSAYNVAEALPREQYELLIVGIDKKGSWQFYGDNLNFLVQRQNPKKVALAETGKLCFPGRCSANAVLCEADNGKRHYIDIAFPVLHGNNGEDGAIQGLCKLFGLPCVGCDQSSSANCMDKDITKSILQAHGMRCAPATVLRRQPNGRQPDLRQLPPLPPFPLFVKPARTGSSIGINKVKTALALIPAIEYAFCYDSKVLIEAAIVGREIECAVLDDGQLFCAEPGEVIPRGEFYSYAAKYLTKNGAVLQVPAQLSREQAEEVKELAKKAFQHMGCSGMARVDFFLQADGQWILNEINTIPGFTKISLYPRMLQNSGISYPQLISKLLQRANDNFRQNAILRQNIELLNDKDE